MTSTLFEDLLLVSRGMPVIVDDTYHERYTEYRAAQKRLRAHIEATTPWYPTVPDGFGPWIEWKPGDLGPRVGEIVARLFIMQRQNRSKYTPEPVLVETVQWHDKVVAYCVKESGE